MSASKAMLARVGILVGTVGLLVATRSPIVAAPPVESQPPADAAGAAASRPAFPKLVAANPADAALASELVAQLGSDDPQERDRAQEGLLALGLPAEAALRKVLEGEESPEAKLRAADVLRALASPGRATFVTLRLDRAPLSEALAALSAQSGIPFRVASRGHASPDAPPGEVPAHLTVSVDATRRPFWEVLAEVCAQAGLRPDAVNRDGGFLLLAWPGGHLAKWSAKWTHVHGAAVVVAVSASGHGQLDYARAGSAAPGSAGIDCFLHVEPRLRLVRIRTVDAVQAIDAQGRELDMPANHIDPGATGHAFAKFTPTFYTFADSTLLKVLRGTARVEVESAGQTLTVDRLDRVKEGLRVLGDARLRVGEFRADGADVWKLRVTVYRDGRSDADFQALQARLLSASPKLRLADGRRLVGWHRIVPPYGPPPPKGQEGQELEFTFPADRPAPADVKDVAGDAPQLVWEAPTRVEEIAVPFEFKDVPLP